MADFDFPSSPAVGDTYPDPPIEGSPVWQWDGQTWRGLVPRGAHFVETRPYTEGEFVIHDGRLYVAIRDNGPGVFDPDDWDQIVSTSELAAAIDGTRSDLTTALNDTRSDLTIALNTAVDTAKTDLNARIDNYLPLLGGTLAGRLNLSEELRFLSSPSPAIRFMSPSDSAFQRWAVEINPNFEISRFDDNGDLIDRTLTINRASGEVKVAGALTLNGAPTADLQAATKKYVDDARVAVDVNPPTTPKEGDQWWDSGQGFLYVYFDGQWIAISGPAGPVGPQGPTGPQGAPGLADLNDYVPLTGAVLSGPLTLPGDPTAALHAATKQYVDALEARIAALEALTASLESRIAALE